MASILSFTDIVTHIERFSRSQEEKLNHYLFQRFLNTNTFKVTLTVCCAIVSFLTWNLRKLGFAIY